MSLTATNHAENQEVHLRLPPGPEARRAHIRTNVDEFAGLLGRACPAQVYEYVNEEGSEGESASVENVTASGKKFVINSQVSERSLGCNTAPSQLSILLIATPSPVLRRARSIGRSAFTLDPQSWLRTVSTASSVISKCLPRTLHGRFPKGAADRSIVSLCLAAMRLTCTLLLICFFPSIALT